MACCWDRAAELICLTRYCIAEMEEVLVLNWLKMKRELVLVNALQVIFFLVSIASVPI